MLAARERHGERKLATVYDGRETQDPRRDTAAGSHDGGGCRKHSVSPSLVYRWRAVAQQSPAMGES